MTADHLAARLLGALLSLRARFFPHQRPKVYEVSNMSVVKMAKEWGAMPLRVRGHLQPPGVFTISLPYPHQPGTLIITSEEYAEEFGSKGERAS